MGECLIMNSINLVGNISTDIDLKATPKGDYVAKFSLAVNSPYNREKTSFIPVEVWKKKAENTAQYCAKGSKISVSGYIEVESWEKDGKKNYRTKVIADQIGFLDSKKGNSSPAQDKPAPQHARLDEDPFANGGQIDISDDDLPF